MEFPVRSPDSDSFSIVRLDEGLNLYADQWGRTYLPWDMLLNDRKNLVFDADGNAYRRVEARMSTDLLRDAMLHADLSTRRWKKNPFMRRLNDSLLRTGYTDAVGLGLCVADEARQVSPELLSDLAESIAMYELDNLMMCRFREN